MHMDQGSLDEGAFGPRRRVTFSFSDSLSGLSLIHIYIMRKFKRAVTDCETAVRFDKDNKPGISNLLAIYCAATGKTLSLIHISS